MNKQKTKIFLSYAREDMGIAKQLYNDLKRYGLDIWLSPSRTGIQNWRCLAFIRNDSIILILKKANTKKIKEC